MSYFQEYEARKKHYKDVKPGTVWRLKPNPFIFPTICKVVSVNLSNETFSGIISGQFISDGLLRILLHGYDLIE
jgi:hypothetical protein